MDVTDPATGVEATLRLLDRLVAYGAARGNNTSILTVGFGTAVDALMAVKELVYERREISLADLGCLMSRNWAGREDLRLRMLRAPRKWGANDPEAAGGALPAPLTALRARRGDLPDAGVPALRAGADSRRPRAEGP